MNKYHITEEDYRRLVEAVLAAKYPQVMEARGGVEAINLSDPIPGVEIILRHWEDGRWTVGGTDDYGRKEMIWEATRHYYAVDSFEFFDTEGNDVETDFSADVLVKLLAA